MDAQALLLTLACSATAHLITACVIGIYARYKVQYLSLMWVNAIFAFALIFTSFFYDDIAAARPVFMHPLMLLTLSSITFLQSIFPLSVPMPGFLQWGRMLRYARLPISLFLIYVITDLLVGQEITLLTAGDFLDNFYQWDVLVRLASICSSLYYIINILRLPRTMARSAKIPTYLHGYCAALGMVMLFYLIVSIFYSTLLVTIYLVLMTLLNVYLAFRTLEEMAIHLPSPSIPEDSIEQEHTQTEENTPAEDTKDETAERDFNEANLLRFYQIQKWMQHNKDQWISSSFGREQLCREVGLNRHLVLQSLRSQGYNNVHDYIVGYRVAELKYLIHHGHVKHATDASLVGFGAAVTARNCFMRIEGRSLDDYIALYNTGEA